MPRPPIYLDNHATTRSDPRVVEAMLPYFSEHYGNAASRNHGFGRVAEEAVDAARDEIAELIGASAKEIVFTSGATESDNLALKGVADRYRQYGDHLVTCVTEHPAVLDVCRRLEADGWRITYLPVDTAGRVSASQVEEALTPRTVLVSLMLANNEIGTIHPIAAIGKICKARGVLLHTDAAQAVGKIPVDVETFGVDLMSISAHKMYGPKGVGALYVRRRNPAVRLEPQMDGGGHERGMRSGTLPVPLIVGFGVAAQLCCAEMATESVRTARLRDKLYRALAERIAGVALNGPPLDAPDERLPNNLNVSFADVRGEALLMALRNIAASSGSACTSASVEPSRVLRAIGLSDEAAHASIRFGLGRFTTEAEIDAAATEAAAAVEKLRSLVPV
jgi:cysteine desulfurase